MITLQELKNYCVERHCYECGLNQICKQKSFSEWDETEVRKIIRGKTYEEDFVDKIKSAFLEFDDRDPFILYDTCPLDFYGVCVKNVEIPCKENCRDCWKAKMPKGE